MTQPPARYVDEAPGSATVLTLGAHMCKWPIGDPSSDDFTFCGRRASEGPYCVEHARVAYQPAQTKKRSSANELARSLRRYISVRHPLGMGGAPRPGAGFCTCLDVAGRVPFQP